MCRWRINRLMTSQCQHKLCVWVQTVVQVQFVDGLASADMQLRVKQGRPLNLKYAVRHAVDLEACNKAESKRNEGRGYLWSKSQINETQECDTQTLTDKEYADNVV